MRCAHDGHVIKLPLDKSIIGDTPKLTIVLIVIFLNWEKTNFNYVRYSLSSFLYK